MKDGNGYKKLSKKSRRLTEKEISNLKKRYKKYRKDKGDGFVELKLKE